MPCNRMRAQTHRSRAALVYYQRNSGRRSPVVSTQRTAPALASPRHRHVVPIGVRRAGHLRPCRQRLRWPRGGGTAPAGPCGPCGTAAKEETSRLPVDSSRRSAGGPSPIAARRHPGSRAGRRPAGNDLAPIDAPSAVAEQPPSGCLRRDESRPHHGTRTVLDQRGSSPRLARAPWGEWPLQVVRHRCNRRSAAPTGHRPVDRSGHT